MITHQHLTFKLFLKCVYWLCIVCYADFTSWKSVYSCFITITFNRALTYLCVLEHFLFTCYNLTPFINYCLKLIREPCKFPNKFVRSLSWGYQNSPHLLSPVLCQHAVLLVHLCDTMVKIIGETVWSTNCEAIWTVIEKLQQCKLGE